MSSTWTVVGSVISGFLLLGLALNVTDPDIRANEVVIVLYLALCGGLVLLGRKIDRMVDQKRRRRPRS